MKNKLKLVAIFILAIQGCASDRGPITVTAKPTDNRACVANFSTDGGFWAGKQFKTFEDFSSISKANAFDGVITTITSNGYQVVNANKELGIISANQTVSFGHGKTVPLNTVVKNNNSGGVRVELSFSLSGGLITSSDSVQEEFCKILSSVSKVKEEAVATPAPETSKEVAPETKTTTSSKRKSRKNQ